MRRPDPNPWPAALVAFGLLFLAGLGLSMYWGITRSSRVSDPAYYARGLQYGARLRAEAAARGWRLDVERDGAALVLTVTDATGQPVDGLVGAVTLLAPDGTPGTRLPAVPAGHAGRYRVEPGPVPPPGARAVAELERRGTVLRRHLLLAP